MSRCAVAARCPPLPPLPPRPPRKPQPRGARARLNVCGAAGARPAPGPSRSPHVALHRRRLLSAASTASTAPPSEAPTPRGACTFCASREVRAQGQRWDRAARPLVFCVVPRFHRFHRFHRTPAGEASRGRSPSFTSLGGKSAELNCSSEPALLPRPPGSALSGLCLAAAVDSLRSGGTARFRTVAVDSSNPRCVPAAATWGGVGRRGGSGGGGGQ